MSTATSCGDVKCLECSGQTTHAGIGSPTRPFEWFHRAVVTPGGPLTILSVNTPSPEVFSDSERSPHCVPDCYVPSDHA
jgi:hypothetical protein